VGNRVKKQMWTRVGNDSFRIDFISALKFSSASGEENSWPVAAAVLRSVQHFVLADHRAPIPIRRQFRSSTMQARDLLAARRIRRATGAAAPVGEVSGSAFVPTFGTRKTANPLPGKPFSAGPEQRDCRPLRGFERVCKVLWGNSAAVSTRSARPFR